MGSSIKSMDVGMQHTRYTDQEDLEALNEDAMFLLFPKMVFDRTGRG
jgi:hypothetical protein